MCTRLSRLAVIVALPRLAVVVPTGLVVDVAVLGPMRMVVYVMARRHVTVRRRACALLPAASSRCPHHLVIVLCHEYQLAAVGQTHLGEGV